MKTVCYSYLIEVLFRINGHYQKIFFFPALCININRDGSCSLASVQCFKKYCLKFHFNCNLPHSWKQCKINEQQYAWGGIFGRFFDQPKSSEVKLHIATYIKIK